MGYSGGVAVSTDSPAARAALGGGFDRSRRRRAEGAGRDDADGGHGAFRRRRAGHLLLALTVAGLEAGHAAAGVENLLLARVERVIR